MRDACARSAIAPAVGFHVLRHTHASILAMRGVPMAVIATARTFRHPLDRAPLCASRTELRRRHDPGEFSEVDGGLLAQSFPSASQGLGKARAPKSARSAVRYYACAEAAVGH
jgi:hypothetical protein